jgi:hypothetical protein
LGYPVVAISTAIRVVPQPHYWIIADSLNQYHGTEGKVAWNDSRIQKIVPKGKKTTRNNSVIEVDYSGSGRKNETPETLFIHGKPLVRGPHKTITFAIQWLHLNGFQTLIFAGNDLKANSFEEKYAYDLQDFDKKKRHNFKKTIDDVHSTLISWYPIAKQKGYEWYSWKCGSVFSAMVPELPENFPIIDVEIPIPETEKEIENTQEKNSVLVLRESQNELVRNFSIINENEWKEKSKNWISSFHQSLKKEEKIPKRANPQQTRTVLKKETHNQIKKFSNGKQ